MKTSIFSRKGLIVMSLSVGLTFSICLFVCSLYVKDNHVKVNHEYVSENLAQLTK